MGRWTSPDPSGLASVDMTNPQTWNRYAYVMNNPMSYVDPNGTNVMAPCRNSPQCNNGDTNNPFTDVTGGGSGLGGLIGLAYIYIPGDSYFEVNSEFPELNGEVDVPGYWVYDYSANDMPYEIAQNNGTASGGGRHYVQSTKPYRNDTSSGVGAFKNYADSDFKAAGAASGLSVLFLGQQRCCCRRLQYSRRQVPWKS